MHNVPLSELSVYKEREIGRGAFGMVCLGKWLEKTVAVKVIQV